MQLGPVPGQGLEELGIVDGAGGVHGGVVVVQHQTAIAKHKNLH